MNQIKMLVIGPEVHKLILPMPDEEPVANCPVCDKKFHIGWDQPDDHFVQEDIDVWRCIRSGKLVQFVIAGYPEAEDYNYGVGDKISDE